MSCISTPDRLSRTGRDHGIEMKDETAIQLGLGHESKPGSSGWQLRIGEVGGGGLGLYVLYFCT